METKERTEPAHQLHKRQGLIRRSPQPLPFPLHPTPSRSAVKHSASLFLFTMCTHTPRTRQSSWGTLSFDDLSASIFAPHVMRDWNWVTRCLPIGKIQRNVARVTGSSCCPSECGNIKNIAFCEMYASSQSLLIFLDLSLPSCRYC